MAKESTSQKNRLSKSNKDKLVGGIIGVIFLVITLSIKECYDNRKPKATPNEAKIEEINTVVSNDSSTQQIIVQSDQINANNGNVTNEYVFGDKNINRVEPTKNSPIPRAQPMQNQESPGTKIEKIENNGNLSVGQTGGTVTQTTIINPKEKFIDEEKREIIRNINLKYRAVGQDGAKCVQLIPNSYRSESHQLCDDLEAFLKEQGYIIAPNSGNILNWGKVDDRVTYRVSENSCMLLVISY